MPAYAEGFALLSAYDEVLPSMDVRQNGCSIRSFLLEQTIAALREKPRLDGVSSRVSDSGTGRWAAEEAIPTRHMFEQGCLVVGARWRSSWAA